jgi:DNA-binding MarR family transcriptional regulator
LGLVRRQQGKVDGREVEVHLTSEGEKKVKKLARMHRDELLSLQGIFRVPGLQELVVEDVLMKTTTRKSILRKNITGG